MEEDEALARQLERDEQSQADQLHQTTTPGNGEDGGTSSRKEEEGGKK